MAFSLEMLPQRYGVVKNERPFSLREKVRMRGFVVEAVN